jgi:16S rRNA (adenine1518-N6/adenine1519-N6)-dimethyltransferase
MMIDVRPKKRFGQNFLRDQSVVERILSAAGVDAGGRVLEIGPGLGALTERLLERGAEMTVMEVDRELAARLEERHEPRLTVHQGDALRLDWEALLFAPPYRLVANLPYNISSQILFKILDHHRLFSRLVLMFQKEVGDRICAAPGGRDYGILSVFCQLWFDVKRVTVVHPGAFFPPPKVQSVVLCFEPLAAPRVPVADEAFFRRVVKGAFAQRRKTLRNALVGAGFAAGLDAALADCGIDPGRRGETLSLAEFARLSERLAAVSENSRQGETSC